MERLTLPNVPDIDDATLRAQLWEIINNKTKPLGALGRLEALAVQIGLIQQTIKPKFSRPQIRVFAADHGLAQHGTSAYPSAVTAQMVLNFLSGGAAINVLARQHDIELSIVDAGVATDFLALDTNHAVIQSEISHHAHLITKYKVRRGSRDALIEPAMSQDECLQALHAGIQIAKHLECNLFIAGEMGIGNTSAASLLLSRLEDLPIEDCVGRGTGLDDAQLEHKLVILRQVLQRHKHVATPLEILATFGGLEIAMMAGAYMQAASDRRVLLVDGFISSVAMLIAERLAPGTVQYAIFAHNSVEPGHAHLLGILDAEPLLDFEMRLGEGSGAALAYPILQSACKLLNEMASFAEAGVSQKDEQAGL